MRLKAALRGDLKKQMRIEVRRAEKAVTSGIRDEVGRLKAAVRRDVVGAGLGRRLANSWRGEIYPRSGQSLGAAGAVYTKAPHIMEGFERGLTIKGRDGLYLAIPTPNAPKKIFGKRASPAAFEKATGIKLRFVYRPRGASLLVADGMRAAGGKNPGRVRQIRARKATKTRGARSDLRGRVTAPMFWLVSRVKIPKKISFFSHARRAQAALPRSILRHWKDHDDKA